MARLHFTFIADFVRRFFPYNTRFKGKMRIDGIVFYIHDYYPTRCKVAARASTDTTRPRNAGAFCLGDEVGAGRGQALMSPGAGTDGAVWS